MLNWWTTQTNILMNTKKIILNVKLFKLAEDMHWTIYTGKQQLYI